MRLRTIGLLLLVPLVDAILLVALAASGVIPGTVVVLLVVLTALVGMLLVRAEGRHTLRKMQRKLVAGDPPTDELVDGALLIAAGAFLLTPGLVTDAIGFLLAIPLTRWPIRRFVKGRATKYIDVQSGGFATGKVYTAGFPFDDDEFQNQGGFSTQDTASSQPDNTYTIDPDAYDIDIEDESDNSSA